MDITVTFIGNATMLLTVDGISLLTDPNFLHRGERAYLGYGLLSKRLHDPALTIDRLPALDAVLLSHMHGDHWDRVAHNGLDRTLPVITTPHAAKRLRRRGFSHSVALDTWQHHTITKGVTTVTVTALPGRHAPTPIDRFLPPVMGSMVEVSGAAGPARRLYISGDRYVVSVAVAASTPTIRAPSVATLVTNADRATGSLARRGPRRHLFSAAIIINRVKPPNFSSSMSPYGRPSVGPRTPSSSASATPATDKASSVQNSAHATRSPNARMPASPSRRRTSASIG
jgi:hypothetical protein